MTRPAIPRALPRYEPPLPYSWVLGAFPVLSLLRHAPHAAREIRVHGDLAEDRLDAVTQACRDAGVPWWRDDATVVAKRSKGTARVLAVFDKPVSDLDDARPHLLLHAPRDPGNVGATLRTALAFGIEDVAVTPGPDPWSPHVTRASQGAVFALRMVTPPTLSAYRARRPDRPLLMLDGSAPRTLPEVATAPSPATVAVGPEWPGFTADELALGTPVRIAHDPRVESLNLTVAAGIALHALRARPDAAGPA